MSTTQLNDCPKRNVMPTSDWEVGIRTRARCAAIGLLLGVLVPSAPVYADGGCPPGMAPFQFAPNQPTGCAPFAGDRQRQIPELWSDRSGAIALDWSHDILSGVTNMESVRAARASALDDCRSRGGTQCEIERSYTNGCAAVTVGDPDRFNSSAAATLERAVAIGMETCANAGSRNCRTFYGACSFPERIQ